MLLPLADGVVTLGVGISPISPQIIRDHILLDRRALRVVPVLSRSRRGYRILVLRRLTRIGRIVAHRCLAGLHFVIFDSILQPLNVGLLFLHEPAKLYRALAQIQLRLACLDLFIKLFQIRFVIVHL